MEPVRSLTLFLLCPSVNPLDSIFTLYPDSYHCPPSLLPSSWSKPLSSPTWIIATAHYLVFLLPIRPPWARISRLENHARVFQGSSEYWPECGPCLRPHAVCSHSATSSLSFICDDTGPLAISVNPPGRLLPQGLCTCPSLWDLVGLLPHFLRSSLTCRIFSEAFPEHHLKFYPLLHQSLYPFICLISGMFITVWHSLLLFCFIFPHQNPI